MEYIVVAWVVATHAIQAAIDATVALAIGTVVVAAVALVDRKVENCP